MEKDEKTYQEKLDEILLASLENGDSDEVMTQKGRLFMIEDHLGSKINDKTKEEIVLILEEADHLTEELFLTLENKRISGKEYGISANMINRKQFQKIAKLIGKENFEILFKCDPENIPDLGDPEIAADIYDIEEV